MPMYLITARIHSKSGAPTQLVIGEHPAPNLGALAEELNSQDFIKVLQFHNGPSGLQPAGETLLHQKAIAKVRPMFNDRDVRE